MIIYITTSLMWSNCSLDTVTACISGTAALPEIYIIYKSVYCAKFETVLSD